MGTQEVDGWGYRCVDYASPLADRVGKLTASRHDLEDIGEALDRLVDRGNDMEALDRAAYWTFAVTRYGRLFTSGRRNNAIASALKAVLAEAPPGARTLHDDLLAIRHQHAAHVDGDLDEDGVLIHIRIRNGNELQRRVEGYSGGGVAPSGPVLNNFRTLVAKLVEAVKRDYERAHARLVEEVNALTAERLASAPPSTKLDKVSVDWQSLGMLRRQE